MSSVDLPVRMGNKSNHVDLQAVLDVLGSKGSAVRAKQANQVRNSGHDLFGSVFILQASVEILVLERQQHLSRLSQNGLAKLFLFAAHGSQANNAFSIAARRDPALDVEDLACVQEFTTGIGIQLRR